MTQLIISEKPSSCLKIAEALSDKKLIKKKEDKVYYYELEHKGEKILVGCAVGHLYNLDEKVKAFNPQIAKLQYNAFLGKKKNILSNQEASKQIQANKKSIFNPKENSRDLREK